MARPRRSVRVALLVGLLLLTAGTSVVAAQPTQQVGGTVVVEADETVGDVTAYGGTVIVRGTVEGDLTAVGGRVVLEEGSEVTGRVRAVAGSVELAGTVGGNTVLYAGRTTVTESADLRGSFGAVGGGASLAGTFRNDVTTVTGAATLAPTADVNGLLIHVGQLDDEGGDVRLGTRSLGDLALVPSLAGPAGVLLTGYTLAAEFLTGALLVRAFPAFARDAVHTTVEEPDRIVGAGVAATLGVPLVVAVAALTILGLPLALALLAGYLVLLWLGSIYGRYLLGAGLLSRTDYDSPTLALFAGIVALALLALLPYVGPLLKAAVAVVGVGVLTLGLYGVYTSVRTPQF